MSLILTLFKYATIEGGRKDASKKEAELGNQASHISEMVNKLKKEGRKEDSIFALKMVSVWISARFTQQKMVEFLTDSIKYGIDPSTSNWYSRLVSMEKKNLQDMAKLAVANFELYNEILGCKLTEQDLNNFKKLADGK